MAQGRLITVLNKGLDFAMAIDQVREVIPVGEIFALPGAVDPFLGLLIYRDDTVLPVFSLGGVLGRESGTPGPLVVVVQTGEFVFGLPVDRIGGLMQDPGDDGLEPHDGEQPGPAGAIRGTVVEGERHITVLNLDNFFQ